MSQSNQNNRPLPANAKDRKERPMYRGLIAYFPDALAEIANVSHVGNEQHNPGEEMHWARDKSRDHADCIIRHLVEQGSMDDDGLRHSAKMAWRALALLQIEIEAEQRGRAAEKEAFDIQMHRDVNGLPQDPRDDFDPAAKGIPPVTNSRSPRVYIAGPMRGYEKLNFPTFDTARDLATLNGWDPISPADIDRENDIHEDVDPEEVSGVAASRVFAERDCGAIIGLKAELGDAIAMLPGWTNSTGARAEFFLADWVGLEVLNALTMEPFTIQEQKEYWDAWGHQGLAELKAAGMRIIGKGE